MKRIAVVGLVLACSACGGDRGDHDSASCPAGTAGCPCLDEKDRCARGLTCLSDLCVGETDDTEDDAIRRATDGGRRGSADAATDTDDRATGDAGPTSSTAPDVATDPGAPLGAGCIDGSLCESGFCVDGVCCESACDEPCVRCDVAGDIGSCVAIAGVPTGDRPACAGDGSTCAGACDGVARDCVYPGTSVNCGADCSGTCDGAGHCSVSGTACPGNFACQGGACATTCVDESGCGPFFACDGGQCVRVPEADCLDGEDDNGDGLADCADPSCNARVECIPDPGNGAQLGFTASSCGNVAYPEATALGRDPGPGQGALCSGCICSPPHTRCSFTVTTYASDASHTCSSAAVSAGSGQIRNVSNSDDICAYSLSSSCVGDGVRPESVLIGAPTNPQLVSSCTGAANVSGTPRPPTASFSTTSKYCAAAQVSNTCEEGSVCVARHIGVRCARYEGGGTCGGIYSEQTDWFSAIGADTRTCMPCSQLTCSATAASCPTSFSLRVGSAEATCTEGGAPPANVQSTYGFAYPSKPSGCDPDGPAQCHSNNCYNHYCSFKQESSSGWGTSSCSITSDSTVVSGSVAGSGLSTVCCTP